MPRTPWELGIRSQSSFVYRLAPHRRSRVSSLAKRFDIAIRKNAERYPSSTQRIQPF